MYLLSANHRYKPLMPNYFVSQDPELSNILEPVWKHPNLVGVEKHGGSFWFVIQ